MWDFTFLSCTVVCRFSGLHIFTIKPVPTITRDGPSFCLRIKKSIRRLKDEKTGAHTFGDTVGRIVSGSFLHFVFSVFTMHILV